VRYLLPLCFAIAIIALPTRALAADFSIDYSRLTPSLRLLTDDDRAAVERAVEAIKAGNDTIALASLTSLTASNPENSSLRILAAYAQLRLGNLLGALDQARRAEKAPDGNAYKCVFLSRVALAAGDRRTCQHELDHALKAGERGTDITAVQNGLKQNKRKL
jgi:hypothetical protein